jgi:hypothetical protein
MGEALSLRPDQAVVASAEIVNGAGLTLRLVTENGAVYEGPVAANRTTVAVELPARRYVRAELVGNMAPDRLPEKAPAGLDLREWRWALSNPVYINQP